jgi:hypothetical protein
MIIAEICTLILGIWIGRILPRRPEKKSKRGPVNLNE